MVIKTDFTALNETKWYEYGVRFALVGVITAVAGIVANAYGPVIGGLFLAFPAIFPAGVTLIAKHERRGRGAAAVESAGAVMGSVGLALFASVAWLLLPALTPSLFSPERHSPGSPQAPRFGQSENTVTPSVPPEGARPHSADVSPLVEYAVH